MNTASFPFVLSLLAVKLIGLFAGAALFISFTSAPHYRNPKYSTSFLLEQWRSQIDGAAAMQAMLAVLSSLLSLLAAFTSPATTPKYLIFFSGVMMAAIVVYTMVYIIPVNNQLKVEKNMDMARNNLVAWERRHLLRTVLSFIALASASAAVWQLAGP